MSQDTSMCLRNLENGENLYQRKTRKERQQSKSTQVAPGPHPILQEEAGQRALWQRAQQLGWPQREGGGQAALGCGSHTLTCPSTALCPIAWPGWGWGQEKSPKCSEVHF